MWLCPYCPVSTPSPPPWLLRSASQSSLHILAGTRLLAKLSTRKAPPPHQPLLSVDKHSRGSPEQQTHIPWGSPAAAVLMPTQQGL